MNNKKFEEARLNAMNERIQGSDFCEGADWAYEYLKGDEIVEFYDRLLGNNASLLEERNQLRKELEVMESTLRYEVELRRDLERKLAIAEDALVKLDKDPNWGKK